MNDLHPTTRAFAIERSHIRDPFWTGAQALVRDAVIPHQWNALNDRIAGAEKSCALENFRIAAGHAEGTFHGMVFQDSDVYKWIEAAALQLRQSRNASLERDVDETIDLIAAAQQPDGYLNTYFTIKAPDEKWTNLAECHEMYCAGHLFEAACAYAGATGKIRLLEIACRFADHIDTIFGPREGTRPGYPGHPEIELGLLRLFDATGEERYKALARAFIMRRGQKPHYFDEEYEARGRTWFWRDHATAWMAGDKAYSQAHVPFLEQDKAVGHAVRAVYLYTGAAHLARLERDALLLRTCRTLWDDMTGRQMYVTGAIGAQSRGEAFTSDDDLPNDTAYAESCASVGLMMFARRMIENEGDARYADVMERALYNTVRAGMSLDGTRFFYVNPLEVTPATLRGNHIYDHVQPQRQIWFACACCPPNIARTIAGLEDYVHTTREDGIYVNLYIGGETRFTQGEKALTLVQSGGQPWSGDVSLELKCDAPCEVALMLRKPSWAGVTVLRINGARVEAPVLRGYLRLECRWNDGDRIEIEMEMPVRLIHASPSVREQAGQAVLQRGPIVFCLEERDNGAALHQLRMDPDARPSPQPGEGLLAGMTTISVPGRRETLDGPDDGTILHEGARPISIPATLRFVPYFAWANRGEGEMRVWVRI